jgi:hypothetical protein
VPPAAALLADLVGQRAQPVGYAGAPPLGVSRYRLIPAGTSLQVALTVTTTMPGTVKVEEADPTAFHLHQRLGESGDKTLFGAGDGV